MRIEVPSPKHMPWEGDSVRRGALALVATPMRSRRPDDGPDRLGAVLLIAIGVALGVAVTTWWLPAADCRAVVAAAEGR